jgi:hypothetical protein
MDILNIYCQKIKEKLKTKIANEQSFRTDLENLLNSFKPENTKILQEAKKEDYESGTPDFKVFKRIDPKEQLSYNLLIGYIETKKPNENLDEIRKTKQIKKYLAVSPNIILTDFNRFIHLSYDEVIQDITLFDFKRGDKLFEFEITEEKAEDFKKFLDNFFLNYKTRKITTKKELAKVLSSQAFYLSIKTREVIEKDDNKYFRFKKFFNKTFNSFRGAVKYEFDIKEFCDIFAQSVAYGLFVAHIEGINIEEDIDLAKLLPREFDLLAEFIYFSAPSFNIPKKITFTIENIKKTITLIDLEKINKELSTNTNSLSIYLYEDFLKEFDNLRGTEKRKEGGVFYTPEPVVKFIVKSVKTILKDKFNKNGFKDKSIKVLDPATGTGSFLAEVFNSIIEDINSHVLKKEVVKEYFVNNIYGFELMFVPYIVAHLKLSHILKNIGCRLEEEEKLKIYLTNTIDLDQDSLKLEMPLLLLEEEYEESRKIKTKENVLVILGNPPYNNKSKNRGEKILKLLKTYKEGLNEKKINLDDDYIKFIRFAQWKLLEQQNNLLSNQSGILSFITNNSFIWGRTHRKMRESLYNSFDEVYILNLHGNNDPKNDKNIFDIKIGVCISIFVKYPEYNEEKKVFYYSTLENNILSREDKFKLLNSNNYNSINWKQLKITEPYYWFIDRDLSNEEYENNSNFWKMDKIFNQIVSGIDTNIDRITIHVKKDYLNNILNDFKMLDEEKIKSKYEIDDKKSRDWKVKWAKDDLLRNNGKIIKIYYRPFDIRYTYYSGKSKGFIANPRQKTMKHILKNNLGLVFRKTNDIDNFSQILITDFIVERGCLKGITGGTYQAPLYLYLDDQKETNFTHDFKEFIKTKPYSQTSPENILAYIYAVLYYYGYREKYIEYLKFDYPKIPFTDDIDVFNKMVEYGEELINLHLMKDIPEYSNIEINSDIKDYSKVIEKLTSKQRYKNNRIYINKNLFIENVEKEIWEYKIGGYQVIDKWLKYRIGMEIVLDDITHLENMVKIIKKTIELQNNINAFLNDNKLF